MELVASQILQDGIDNPALVDEIYLQVMMQCTANDKASPDEGFPAFRAVATRPVRVSPYKHGREGGLMDVRPSYRPR